MSRFDDNLAAVLPNLLEHHGQTVTYTAADGTPTVLTAYCEPARAESETTDTGLVRRQTRKVLIGTDPTAAEGGVAEPAANATVTIGSSNWQVRGVEQAGAVAVLDCVSTASAERAGPGYRRRV